MNLVAFLQLVAPLIPQVIRIVEETFPGPKRGKAKRAKALKTIESLARTVPALAVQIESVSKKAGKMIDQAVYEMNNSGQP